MLADPRLDGLLARWEELREQGKPVTAEELCSDCPALVAELREQIGALEAMDRLLVPPPEEVDVATRVTESTDSAAEPGPSTGSWLIDNPREILSLLGPSQAPDELGRLGGYGS